MAVGSPKFNPERYYLPEGEPLPSPAQILSPLKRKVSDTAARQFHSRKRLNLGEGKELKLDIPEGAEASNYYHNLPPLLNAQARGIENCMEVKALSSEKKGFVRAKVIQIIKNEKLSESHKLVELGIVHYLIATGREVSLPEEPTLFFLRLEEMESLARELREAHRETLSGKAASLLPSGSTAYLLRSFARMIFPPDGALNIGGCFVIEALLNSHLALQLSEEMRELVLNVVQRLIHDRTFRQLFCDPFTVDPRMAELIFIDTKIEFSEEMSFVYVRWALLQALFSTVGQVDEWNCYAVAMIMNLQSRDCDKLLRLLIEVVKTGSFNFDSVEIPVFPLLETRRKYEKDLKVTLSGEELQQLTPYTMTSSLFEKGDFPLSPKRRKTLAEWLKQEFEGEVDHAKQFFLSHKQSFLQQTLLGMLQFACLNSIDPRPGKATSQRVKTIVFLINQIKASFQRFLSDHGKTDRSGFLEFLNQFGMQICNSLFFIDYHQSAPVIEANRVNFQFHSQGLLFNGNSADYQPFCETRRLFVCSDGEMQPIDKLSDFAALCSALLADYDQSEETSEFQRTFVRFQSYLTQNRFLDDLATAVAALNKNESKLPARIYRESDSLFLIQLGGSTALAAGLPELQEKYVRSETITGKNLQELFRELSLSFHRQQMQGPTPPLILSNSSSHAFNVTPHTFETYWANPLRELKQRLVFPGERIRRKKINDQEMSKILRLSLDGEIAELLLTQIPTEFTLLQFVQFVQKEISGPSCGVVLRMANRVAQEIPYSTVLESLSRILVRNQIMLTELELQELLGQLSEKKWDSVSSYQAAKWIHKALLRLPTPKYCSLRLLEGTIRQLFNLPDIIQVGNLNWVGELTEDLKYDYLVITYDPILGQVVWRKRREGIESSLSDEFTKELSKELTLHF